MDPAAGCYQASRRVASELDIASSPPQRKAKVISRISRRRYPGRVALQQTSQGQRRRAMLATIIERAAKLKAKRSHKDTEQPHTTSRRAEARKKGIMRSVRLADSASSRSDNTSTPHRRDAAIVAGDLALRRHRPSARETEGQAPAACAPELGSLHFGRGHLVFVITTSTLR